MDIYQKFHLNIFNKCNIKKTDKLLVGFSGGADSVSLVRLLHRLSKETGIIFAAVHINHMIRGEEADRDEEFCEKICRELSIPLYRKKINVPEEAKIKKISIEEAARNVRYGEFRRLKNELDFNFISVAHNRDDRAETVFMNILRGTGQKGIASMKFRSGDILRPLLNISRSQIEDYLKENNFFHIEDSTNKEDIYSRNKIRNKVFPYIDAEFETDIRKKLYDLSEVIEEDKEFMDKICTDMYKNISSLKEHKVFLERKEFLSCHIAIQKRIIFMALADLGHNLKNIGKVHLEQAIELIHEGNTGKKAVFPGNFETVIDYNNIVFRRKQDTDIIFFESIKIRDGLKVYIDEICTEIMFDVIDGAESVITLRNSSENYFDMEKTGDFIEIRQRKDGDIFFPLKGNGTKKLKKYFIDKKINYEQRNKYIIFAKSNEVFWIFDENVSDNFKVTGNTKKIVKISVRKA